MTTVAIWINREMPASHIWAVGDTRLSSTGNQKVGVLDEATKLFSLPIRCCRPDSSGFFSDCYFSHTIGFAYAGNATIGLNLYSALLPLLSGLASVDGSVPRLDHIAEFVVRLLYRLTHSRNQHLMDRASAEVSIFGYCCVESRFRIFHLTPAFSEQVFRVDFSEVSTSAEDQLLLLGECKDQIFEEIQRKRAGLEYGSIQWWRAPKSVISTIISRNTYPGIGGSLQMGIADERGYFPFMVCSPLEDGAPPATLSYLGLSSSEDLGRIGGCHVNMPGMV